MILLHQNLAFLSKTTCNSIKATIEGSARVWSYEDIVEVQKKEAGAEIGRCQQNSKQYQLVSTQVTEENLVAKK